MIRKPAVFIMLGFICVLTSAYNVSAAEIPVIYADGSAFVTTQVPDSQTVTVTADGATVYVDGTAVDSSFSAARQSQPTVQIVAADGMVVTQVLLNGEDITAQVTDGYYTFSAIYEDMELVVITEKAPDTGDDEETTTASGSDEETTTASGTDSGAKTGDTFSPVATVAAICVSAALMVMLLLSFKFGRSRKE